MTAQMGAGCGPGFAANALPGPQVIYLDVASAWRRLVLAGNLDERRAELALEDLRTLRLDRAPHAPLLSRCWEWWPGRRPTGRCPRSAVHDRGNLTAGAEPILPTHHQPRRVGRNDESCRQKSSRSDLTGSDRLRCGPGRASFLDARRPT